jgi:hypothetical protein
MSNPNPPTSGSAPRWWTWIACVALAGYAVFLTRNSSDVAGGADSSGYLNSARLLAAGELTAALRTPPEFGPQEALRRPQFQPQGFVPFDGNPRLSPTYAVGLPLHLAFVGTVFGWERAPTIVGVTSALAALLLLHGLGRRLGLERGLAATGALILAVYPVFLFTTIQPLSDTLATTWCLTAMYCALRSSAHAGWAVAAGAAVAVAVLVRATNVLLLPAVLVLIGFNARRLIALVLGGLPGAFWLGYYNHALYGSPLRSGYVDITQAFAWHYGPPTFVHFAKWIALLLPAVVLVLPFAALHGRAAGGRILVALALWFAAFAGLYAFYEISHEVWWDLRFILPGTPALILGTLLGVQALAGRWPARIASSVRTIASVALCLWAVGLGWFWTGKFHLLLTKSHEQGYADGAAAARQHFPADALVLSGLHSGALYYYTDFPVLRWELVSPGEFATFRAQLTKTGRAICALLYDVEEREALQQKCPGAWVEVLRMKNISLWKLGDQPPAPAIPPQPGTH